MSRKFTSEFGFWPCRVCGTVYQWSDMRDVCERTEYWRDDASARLEILESIHRVSAEYSPQRPLITPGSLAWQVLRREKLLEDDLAAEVGELVLVTMYKGETYAQPPYKSACELVWQPEKVRERRVVPGVLKSEHHRYSEHASHLTQYKIGELDRFDETIGDNWDTGEVCGLAVGFALGPRHVWSKRFVEGKGEKWPDHVIDMCYGPNDRETFTKMREEGFQLYGDGEYLVDKMENPWQ